MLNMLLLLDLLGAMQTFVSSILPSWGMVIECLLLYWGP